jgi:hypothetical protein
VCQFDYSAFDGPNCCTGRYSLTITNLDASGVPTTNTSISEWGGDPKACIDGAAVDIDAKSLAGFPIGTIQFIEGMGKNGVMEVPSLLQLNTDSRKAGSNLYAANFFNFNFAGYVASGSPGPVPSPFLSAPRAFSAEGRKKLGGAPAPFYEVQCLNRSREILARIQVQVREWNDYAALEARTNPDNVGNESYFDFFQNAAPINDYTDFGNVTRYPRFFGP